MPGESVCPPMSPHQVPGAPSHMGTVVWGRRLNKPMLLLFGVDYMGMETDQHIGKVIWDGNNYHIGIMFFGIPDTSFLFVFLSVKL